MQAPKSCGGELIAFHPNCVAARARKIAEHGHGCLGQGDKILRKSIVHGKNRTHNVTSNPLKTPFGLFLTPYFGCVYK